MRTAFLSLLSLMLATTFVHADAAGRWLLEHGSMEWSTASAGWRTGLGQDSRVPGFEALGGGTELVMGLDVYGPLAVVLDGRFLGGVQDGDTFLEGLGGVGLQLRLSETVRLRAGAAAGQVSNKGEAATLVGGWLASSIDLFPLGGGRLAMVITVRLDIDGQVGEPAVTPAIPGQSLALAVGLGFRY